MYNGLRMATMLRPSQKRLKESQAIQLCCTTNRHSRAASSRIVCVNLGSEEERRINKINLMEAATVEPLYNGHPWDPKFCPL